MSTKHDIPAYPSVVPDHVPCKHTVGMSLRDHFAAEAMNGMLAFGHTEGRNEYYISKKAYAIADAMLEARKVL